MNIAPLTKIPTATIKNFNRLPTSSTTGINTSFSHSSEVEESVLFAYSKNLKDTLKNDPDFLKRPDEDGNTFLHHFAQTENEYDVMKIYNFLNSLEDLDFSIKNNSGDTPLHTAAARDGKEIVHVGLISRLINLAAKNNFDFTTLNDDGYSFLHLLIFFPYHHMGKRMNSIQVPLELVKSQNNFSKIVNTLSSSGSSALYYAIEREHFDEAYTLLDNGADPLLFKKDRDLIKMIDGNLRKLKELIENLGSRQEGMSRSLKEFQEMRAKLSHIIEFWKK